MHALAEISILTKRDSPATIHYTQSCTTSDYDILNQFNIWLYQNIRETSLTGALWDKLACNEVTKDACARLEIDAANSAIMLLAISLQIIVRRRSSFSTKA